MALLVVPWPQVSLAIHLGPSGVLLEPFRGPRPSHCTLFLHPAWCVTPDRSKGWRVRSAFPQGNGPLKRSSGREVVTVKKGQLVTAALLGSALFLPTLASATPVLY